MSVRRLLPLAVLLALMGGLPTASALASSDQQSIMVDDDLLLYRGDHVRTRAMVRMAQFGVDTVRVTLLWRVVADGADPTNADIRKLKSASARKRARRQRKRFDPSDPRTYPTRNWDRFDNVVKDAAALHMHVYFTVTGPPPPFARGRAPHSQRANALSYKPKVGAFGDFVEAVGKRYSGTYKDENALRKPLPRVSLWSLWNEPNQSGWLSPQYEKRQGKVIPVAPIMYRELYMAGHDALAKTGHGADTILLGETAPIGSTGHGPRTPMRPTPFLREMMCVSPQGVPYSGADAARRKCSDFDKGPLLASGYAHHAYTKKAAPTVRPHNADDLTIANIGTLGPLLDNLSLQTGGKLPAGLPVWITEFGYESKPPDPRNGISLARQADYDQLGEFLAYTDPRVVAMTQFQLRDAPPLKQFRKGSRYYWFSYQSGLFTQKGKAKPAATAYLLPFIAYKSGAGVGFWGQLRFRPNGSPDVAVVQSRPDAKSPWVQIAAVPTSARGFFSTTAAAAPAGTEYRAAYVDPTTGRIGAASLPAKP